MPRKLDWKFVSVPKNNGVRLEEVAQGLQTTGWNIAECENEYLRQRFMLIAWKELTNGEKAEVKLDDKAL